VRRLALVLWLVAGLCLQGFALAGQMAALARTGDAVHSALHLDAVSHYHADDGSIHKDASKRSLKHVHGDCCIQLAGVLPAAPPGIPGLQVTSPRVDAADHGHDSPFLEGLMRPPR